MQSQDAVPGSTAPLDKKNHGAGPRVLAMLVIGAVAGLLIYFSPGLFFGTTRPADEHPRLVTGGTSAIFVVTENLWKKRYAQDKQVEIACESAGTTEGVKRMLEKTYCIAFTHGAVPADVREKARSSGCDVVHVPLLLCGVVPAYHLEELKGKAPLNFTGEVLAGIFLGKIHEWNDPALKKINPGVELPAKKITVVVREDSSGTTQLFTEYLAAVGPAWREQVGKAAAEVKWPVGVSARRNQGVAALIHETDGAIGYVDRMYTSFQDIVLDYGAVENKDQTAFVRAEPANLTAAARAVLADTPEDLAFDLINKPGRDSYPIAGVIFAVCSNKQSEADRKQVVDFLHWATHEGQADAAKASFAPLPVELVERVDHRLEAITAVP